jgi:hypothetical protein
MSALRAIVALIRSTRIPTTETSSDYIAPARGTK